jgi:acyl dehydratase
MVDIDTTRPPPQFKGDTVGVTTEATAKRRSKPRPEAGQVEFLRRAFEQSETLVAERRHAAFMRRRPQPTTAG